MLGRMIGLCGSQRAVLDRDSVSNDSGRELWLDRDQGLLGIGCQRQGPRRSVLKWLGKKRTMGPRTRVGLRWLKFSKLTDARAVFSHQACVYVQADADGRPLRIGKASKGLE